MSPARDWLLGIDVGTSSTKAVILEAGSGRLAAVSVRRHRVSAQHDDRAESDPEDWLRSARRAVRGALRRARQQSPGAVAAVGLSGQMHGLVLADRAGAPLRPAILWADRRARAEAARYLELGEQRRRALANPAVAGMTGPLLCWVAAHEPGAYARAAWALQAKDWLRLRLTGRAGAEHSDASGTLLYDFAEGGWSRQVVAALGLRGDLLAPLARSDDLAGGLTAEAAGILDLPEGIPVAYGAADTAAALEGTGAPRPGELQLTIGTGAQVVAARGEPLPDRAYRYHLFARPRRGFYALAAVQAAGLAFEWAWRVLGCGWPAAYRALRQAPAGARGISFVPHLAGARSPLMDDAATGVFAGLRLHHRREDLIRGVFEGVAFSIRQAAECLPEFAACSSLRLAGGGARNQAWRQLLADTLGRSLRPVDDPHASARGAATLAGIACRALEPAGAPAGDAGTGRCIRPRAPEADRLRSAYDRWQAVTGRGRSLP